MLHAKSKIGCLAVSYSRMAECHTTIGATAFHSEFGMDQVVPLRYCRQAKFFNLRKLYSKQLP